MDTPIIDRLEYEMAEHGDPGPILAKARELERENAAVRAAIRALATRDFGSQGWDVECESAAIRLRAFLLPNVVMSDAPPTPANSNPCEKPASNRVRSI